MSDSILQYLSAQIRRRAKELIQTDPNLHPNWRKPEHKEEAIQLLAEQIIDNLLDRTEQGSENEDV